MRADTKATLARPVFLRRTLQRGMAMVCLTLPLMIASRARAGEPIQIITPSDKGGLPAELPKEQIRSPLDSMRPSINGGESGQGPVLPPPNQPAIMRDPKLEEMYFRKKNWLMFDSPSAGEGGKEVDQAFGVRKYELDSFDKRPKGDMERYYDATKESNSSRPRSSKDGNARDGSAGRNDLDGKGRRSSREDPQNAETGGIIQELNPALLFNWTPATDGLSSLNSSLNRNSILPHGLGEPAFGAKVPMPGTRDPGQTQRDIERMFDSKKAPMGRFSDPINDQSDSTRSLMNPITARKASGPAPESMQPRIGESGAAFGTIAPVAPRSDYFSFGRERASAMPGLNPTMAAPASSPVLQPKPMILEIPRPRF